jgi:dTDP-4-dehydrorhamnose 3,5-epimerase-like enzyme
MNTAAATEKTECWERVKTLSEDQEGIDQKIIKMKTSFYEVLQGNHCERSLSNGSVVWTCPKGAIFVEAVMMTKQR